MSVNSIQTYYFFNAKENHSRKNKYTNCSICLGPITEPPRPLPKVDKTIPMKARFSKRNVAPISKKTPKMTNWKVVAHKNGGEKHPHHLACIEGWPKICPVCKAETDITPVLPWHKRAFTWLKDHISSGPIRGTVRGVLSVAVGCTLGLLPSVIEDVALQTLPLPPRLTRIALTIALVYYGKIAVRKLRHLMEGGIVGNLSIAPQVAATGGMLAFIFHDRTLGMYAGMAAMGLPTILSSQFARGESLYTSLAVIATTSSIVTFWKHMNLS